MNRASRSERNFRIALFVAVAIGLAVRWLTLRGANWRIDYDEGMVGLQVLRMMRGQFAVFHPGQPYLGNLESYLLLPCFVLFGASDTTLKLIPLLLSGVYVATTGLLGRAAFDRRTGATAALIAAVAPVYLVVVGLKAWGATIETLILGNLVLLIAVGIFQTDESHHKKRDWLLLGFVTGVAFWISWLIALYAIPVLLIVGWRLRHKPMPMIRQGWVAIPAFVVGSLPFWVYNIQYPLATFTFLLGGERSSAITNAPRVLKNFALDLAPRLVSGDPSWHVLSRPSAWLLVVVYGVGLIALVTLRKRRDSWLLAMFSVCFLPIYIVSGFGNNALNPFGIDATGRYVLMLHSVLPIGLAVLSRAGRLKWLAVGLVSMSLTLNLSGLARIDPARVFTSPYYVDQPATLQPLIDVLDAHGITDVWSQVGIAHVLMFETHERILAADYYDRVYAHGLVRFPDVFDAVSAASHVAYVTLILPGQTDTPMDRAFAATAVPYERITPSPTLLVIIPRDYIDPATVLPGLGFQYSR